MKRLTISEKFAKWNKGEYTYSSVEYVLLQNEPGEKINQNFLDLLAGCSICAVGNASCLEFFEIIVKGVHPSKPIKTKRIRICPLGCTSKNCILNK